MQPELVAEVGAWMAKARSDLAAARVLFASGDDLLDVVVYHCQQTAEKALKGFLTAHQSPFSKTHALGPLLSQAAAIEATLLEHQESAEELSPYAWRFRYPGDLLVPERAEAVHAVESAAKLLEDVERRLASLTSEP